MQLSWRVKSQLRTLITFAIIGVAAGIFILYPTNEFVYFYEHRPGRIHARRLSPCRSCGSL